MSTSAKYYFAVNTLFDMILRSFLRVCPLALIVVTDAAAARIFDCNPYIKIALMPNVTCTFSHIHADDGKAAQYCPLYTHAMRVCAICICACVNSTILCA